MPAEFDTTVRLALYREFVRTASPPTAETLAKCTQASIAEVRAALERLAAGKAIVLQPESREVLMANPLCAVPTPFQVRTQGRSYFGSCVWDGLGIMAMLGGDSLLDTSCACCGEAMTIGAREGHLVPASGVIHFAVPAKRWWKNIVFS
ncbi:MAG TPA: organomercurial lyase [Bryobacteraceae bacterium]|nr:organomercurial lyase [Bryobacteraceae bacterium]